MNTIASIIGSIPENKEKFDIKELLCKSIDSIPPMHRKSPTKEYEDDVLRFLIDKKDELGIEQVYRYENSSVDGRIKLKDGRLIDIEIKYRMDWMKACQANWQFMHLIKERNEKFGTASNGIVFFEEFSGDWAKKEKKFTVENGWIHWYVDHYDLKVIKVNLIQCVNGNFKLYPFLKIS